MSFAKKTILVTGSSSGIGADAAKHFARLGGSLAIVGRNEERLNQVAEEIKSAGRTPPLAIVADVTKDAERIIDETIKHFGKLDVLVNNAGIAELGGIQNMTNDSFDRIFDTNVRSVIRLTQLAVPHLEKTKGNIVNISSLAGMRPQLKILAYCISKATLDQFTKCLALELAPKGIRVNSVNPGMIQTPILKLFETDEDKLKYLIEHLAKTYPIGRAGTVDDTTQAIAFLAAESASFLTGVILPVDGGKSIQAEP